MWPMATIMVCVLLHSPCSVLHYKWNRRKCTHFCSLRGLDGKSEDYKEWSFWVCQSLLLSFSHAKQVS